MAICKECVHNEVCKYGENRSNGLYCTGEKCKQFKAVADFVEVVRCRECRYRFKNNNHSKNGCPIIDANIWMDDDDFCSHGERKEGADNG